MAFLGLLKNGYEITANCDVRRSSALSLARQSRNGSLAN